MQKFLLFRIGDRRYGIDLPMIRGIYSKPDSADDAGAGAKNVSPLPSVGFRIPDSNFRVPIYDLSTLLTKREQDDHETSFAEPQSRRVILAAAGNRLLALKVGQIERVVSVENDAVVPMSPIFKGRSLDWFPKVLKHEGELMLVVNPESILNCFSLGSTSETDASFYLTDENDPVELHVEEIGSEFDVEFDLPASLLAEESGAGKLENILTRRIKAETVSDMILRISSDVLEKTVSRELGIVEKIWKEKIRSEK